LQELLRIVILIQAISSPDCSENPFLSASLAGKKIATESRKQLQIKKPRMNVVLV
jgi:hypothetical protein